MQEMTEKQWRALHKGKGHIIKPRNIPTEGGVVSCLKCLKCMMVYVLGFKLKEKK